MKKKLFALSLMAPLLMSCAATGVGIDSCAWTAPIHVSAEDILTEETARQILIHNRTGRRLCGW